MESTEPSNLQEKSACGKPLSLLKRVNKNRQWIKEYVTDAGYLLLNETRNGNVHKVVDLLCKGAPFISDNTGVSPLHFAAYNDSTEITELLLNGGIARDLKNKVHRTALHIAAQKGHTSILKTLLSYGANPDVIDIMQMSPLHWAVEGGHLNCVKLLLLHGANHVEKMDIFGRTPLDIAMDNNMSEIVNILKTKDSVLNIPDKSSKIMQDDQLRMKEKPDESIEKNESHSEKESTEEDLSNYSKDNENSREESGDKAPPAQSLFIRSKKVCSLSPGLEHSYIRDINDDADVLIEEEVQTSVPDKPMKRVRSQSPASDQNYIRTKDDTLEMLKEHGIQMLEPDKVTTVHSAVESGQKVVLTEAGKLALDSISKKEMNTISTSLHQKTPSGMVILQNGQKRIKINPESLKAFHLEKDRGFFRNVPLPSSLRYFEGKMYTEDEDSVLKSRLRTTIQKLRSEAKLLDIFSKRKFRQANLYQEQLLSLTKLNNDCSKEKEGGKEDNE